MKARRICKRWAEITFESTLWRHMVLSSCEEQAQNEILKPRDISWTEVYRRVQGLFDRNLASLTCPLCSGPMKIHVTEADILQMEKDELAGNNIAPSKARCECGFVLLINYCNVCNMKTLYPMRTRCDKTVCFDCINRCYFCNGSLNQAACCWSQDEWCPACQPDESRRCSLCQEYFILELFVCGKCGNSLCDHCLCPHVEEDSDGDQGEIPFD